MSARGLGGWGFVLAALATSTMACGKGAASPEQEHVHPCGDADKTHVHDLNDEDGTEAFIPCAGGGAHDLSGKVKIENTPEGVHIHIDATDEDVNEGALGSDTKQRDAVIVYPKGRKEKSVEIPLVKTAHGYTADKLIAWDELDTKLTDEGAKMDVAIFDHDDGAPAAEELHLSVAVSSGKSCEKAQQEIGQTMDFGKKGGAPAPDLSTEQLGAPLKNGTYLDSCHVSEKAAVDICAFVVKGKAVGVSVGVTPTDKKAAMCVDRMTRKMTFPVGARPDTVKEHFD